MIILGDIQSHITIREINMSYNIFKIIAIAFIWYLFMSVAKSETVCHTHPIYCQILKNNPKIPQLTAMGLSNAIYKASVKFDVSANILTAIIAQESSYNIKAKNCKTGLDKEALLKGELKEVTICFDFGLGQINWRNVKNRKLDILKLMNDKDYSIETAALIMSEFKKRFAKWDDSYWTRYNARNTIKRELYKRLVERYR